MGNAGSSSSPLKPENTSRSDGSPRKRRRSGAGDDAGPASQPSTPTFSGRTPKKSRRKSTGRNERRSLLASDIQTDLRGLEHAGIDTKLSEPERLELLIRKCWEVCAAEVGRESEVDPKFEAAAKEFADKCLGSLKSDLEAACVRPKLGINPKNVEMEKNLKLYTNTLDRLTAEVAVWQEYIGKAKGMSNLPVPSDISLSEEQATFLATLGNPELTTDGTEWETDLRLQVEKIQATVRVLQKLQMKGKEIYDRAARVVEEEAFAGQPNVGDAKALIQGIIG